MLNIDMLHARVMHGILGKDNKPLVITYDGGDNFLHQTHICQQLLKPNCLLDTLTSGYVLHRHCRQGNCWLPFTIPWDCTHSNKEHISHSGSALIHISQPICMLAKLLPLMHLVVQVIILQTQIEDIFYLIIT